ncbi:hypothetical protein ES703_93322 [subsurface metagenome]
MEWMKVGADVIVGGGLGAVDQLVQNKDEQREAEAGAKLPVMQRAGTYLNYGLPIVAIVATALGHLRGDWATRIVTAGSMLAGRKIVYQVGAKTAAWTPWSRNRSAEAARQRALAAQQARAQVSGPISDVAIPVIANETILV